MHGAEPLNIVRPQCFLSTSTKGGFVRGWLLWPSPLCSHHPSPLHGLEWSQGERSGWTRQALSAPQSSSASSTGLIIIISLKTSPAALDKKSLLLSELEFDVLTTVFVPCLLEERARQEGEREI